DAGPDVPAVPTFGQPVLLPRVRPGRLQLEVTRLRPGAEDLHQPGWEDLPELHVVVVGAFDRIPGQEWRRRQGHAVLRLDQVRLLGRGEHGDALRLVAGPVIARDEVLVVPVCGHVAVVERGPAALVDDGAAR